MKLKIFQLNPNPFKKEINGGKLNDDIVEKIQANIKELGLMCIVKLEVGRKSFK